MATRIGRRSTRWRSTAGRRSASCSATGTSKARCCERARKASSCLLWLRPLVALGREAAGLEHQRRHHAAALGQLDPQLLRLAERAVEARLVLDEKRRSLAGIGLLAGIARRRRIVEGDLHPAGLAAIEFRL